MSSQTFSGSPTFAIEVWGKAALFTQPQAKIERQTYSVIPPSAANGLLKSIYWHPGVEYIIDAIQVCNPIQYGTIRVNGITAVAKARAIQKYANGLAPLNECGINIAQTKNRQQMFVIFLKDVRYVLHGHIVINPKHADQNMTLDKAHRIFHQRMEKGRVWSQPYFGCREYTAHFSPYEPGYLNFRECCPELLGYKTLEPMTLFIEYNDDIPVTPHFYRPTMMDGVIEVNTHDTHVWERTVLRT